MNFSDVGRDVSPRELAGMPVDEAMAYLNGAANMLSPDDMPGIPDRETMALHAKLHPLRTALEDFMDVAAGLADRKNLKNAENQIAELKEEGRRLAETMRALGISASDEDSVAEACYFIIEGTRAMLDSRFGEGNNVFAFLRQGASRPAMEGLKPDAYDH